MPPACPGESHVGCYYRADEAALDATGSLRGGSRLLLAREQIARNVSLHRARRWHPQKLTLDSLAASVNLPRTSRGHPQQQFSHNLVSAGSIYATRLLSDHYRTQRMR